MLRSRDEGHKLLLFCASLQLSCRSCLNSKNQNTTTTGRNRCDSFFYQVIRYLETLEGHNQIIHVWDPRYKYQQVKKEINWTNVNNITKISRAVSVKKKLSETIFNIPVLKARNIWKFLAGQSVSKRNHVYLVYQYYKWYKHYKNISSSVSINKKMSGPILNIQ